MSRLRNKKKKGKDRSPSKIPEAKTENTNLLAKPKNDDSSESSSIKDSGYEEPENATNIKEKFKSKGSTGTESVKKIKREKGRSGPAKQEAAEQRPPPVFHLHEINSIWTSCDVEEEDTEETEGKTSVESIRNDSDLEYPDDDPLGVTSPISARTTILG